MYKKSSQQMKFLLHKLDGPHKQESFPCRLIVATFQNYESWQSHLLHPASVAHYFNAFSFGDNPRKMARQVVISYQPFSSKVVVVDEYKSERQSMPKSSTNPPLLLLFSCTTSVSSPTQVVECHTHPMKINF